MKEIRVTGGHPLHGALKVQGSKNAALPILAAALLNGGQTVLRNCPHITDVEEMLHILELLGCSAQWKQDGVVIDTSSLSASGVPDGETVKMRSSVLFLGSLLGRLGEARLAYPGGCVIGSRPVDLHLKGLRSMGVEIREDAGGIEGRGRPAGGSIQLTFPSVGATENLLLAAAGASGVTILKGCAKEPEIVALCEFLQCMGVGIFGSGTRTIMVCPPRKFSDVEYTVPGDRIVAGTYALAAVGCGGSLRITGVLPGHWRGQLYPLRLLGAELSVDAHSNSLTVQAPERARGISFLDTAPYPGFPTDLQSQMMAALTCARGVSCLQETIFEQRFKVIEELNKMGACIESAGNIAVIEGVERLHGASVKAKELRGGAALVLAGLMAEGETAVSGVGYIERGYESICRDLQQIGAQIYMKEG